MSAITINAALRRIAALKGDISRLEGRRAPAISYPSDAPPAWTVSRVEEQIAEARRELVDLKVRLAVANATSKVSVDGEERTLISCIVELQELRGQIAQDETLMPYTKAQESFVQREREYDYDTEKHVVREVPYRCDLTSQVLDERITALRDRFAKLNAVVEAANHTAAV